MEKAHEDKGLAARADLIPNDERRTAKPQLADRCAPAKPELPASLGELGQDALDLRKVLLKPDDPRDSAFLDRVRDLTTNVRSEVRIALDPHALPRSLALRRLQSLSEDAVDLAP